MYREESLYIGPTKPRYFCGADIIRCHSNQESTHFSYTDYEREPNVYVLYDLYPSDRKESLAYFVTSSYIRGLVFGVDLVSREKLEACRTADYFLVTALNRETPIPFEQLREIK